MRVQNESIKNYKTTMILAIFGGFLGLHHFYVGRFGRGLLFMCTFGLFGFGWIIDILKILASQFKDSAGYPILKKEKN